MRTLQAGLIAATLLAAESAQLALGQTSPVVINEILVINNGSYLNGSDTPPWVELYNTTGSPIDLGATPGWSMSDSADAGKERKFVFPPNTIIRAQDFLLVFLDDKTNSPGLHTIFTLKNNGDDLNLYDQSGLVPGSPAKDRVVFGIQTADFSLGRANFTGNFQLNIPTPLAPNQVAPLGSISKLSINEWMPTNNVGSSNDWLEVYNTSANPVPMGGLVFTTATPTNKAIGDLSFIAGNGFFRFWCLGSKLAKNNDELDFKLSHNTGETITLYASDRATLIDQINFPGNNTIPGYWVTTGLVLNSYGRLPDGTPGTNYVRFGPNGIGKPTPEASNIQPLTNVVINEVIAHTDLPLEDAIELYNPTPNPVDISGWWLSNAREDVRKFRIPPNTIIPPFGFKVFYEMVGGTPGSGFNTDGTGTNRMFTFNSAHGDSAVLCTASNDAAGGLTGFWLVQTFPPSQNGVSFGRYLTSQGLADFVPMSRLSLGTSVTRDDPPYMISVFRTGQGTTNPYPRMGPLVINEIMYHPPDIIVGATHIDDSTNEYIEIYNIMSTNVPLYDPAPLGTYYDPNYPQYGVYADGRTNTWRIRGVVDFDFPTNVTLNPGQYLLVVNFNPTNGAMLDAFQQKYAVPPGVQVFGPYGGKLSNKSGSVELYKPDWPQGPAHPGDFADHVVPYIIVEQVHYDDSAPWPTNADGHGASLQRLKPEEYGNDPINWTDSIPTPGRQYVHIESVQKQADSLILGFTGVPYSTYSILYQSVLTTNGPWLKLTDVPGQPTTGLRYVTNSGTQAVPNRMYRVVTPAQQP